MKIVMSFVVRDEEEILRQNLEFHHAMGVDHFIVTDHRSVDKTPEILGEYLDLGILDYIRNDGHFFKQSLWMTNMAHIAFSKHKADWVINNDADEFWWPLKGNMKDSFSTVPGECLTLKVPRTNFVPVEETDKPFFERMIFREKRSFNSNGRPLPPKVCQRGGANIKVGPGSHVVRGVGHNVLWDPPFEVVHYPIRTYKQFENKIVSGTEALELDIPERESSTWKSLYKTYKNGGLFDYYKQMIVDEKLIENRIQEGEIIVDERLLRFFQASRSDQISRDIND